MGRQFWSRIVAYALLVASGITYSYIFVWIYLFGRYGAESNPTALAIEMAMGPVIIAFAVYLILREVRIREKEYRKEHPTLYSVKGDLDEDQYDQV